MIGCKVQRHIKQFVDDTEGTTSVEYAVMLMLIIGGCIVAIESLGGSNGILWGGTMDSVGNAIP